MILEQIAKLRQFQIQT